MRSALLLLARVEGPEAQQRCLAVVQLAVEDEAWVLEVGATKGRVRVGPTRLSFYVYVSLHLSRL